VPRPCEDGRATVRAACIDIGSNTTRLLVAELDPRRPGALVELVSRRHFARLTLADRRAGIAAEKAAAIVAAVAAQAGDARAAGVAAGAMRAVATAALRDVPERDALMARLRAAAGIEVDVLGAAEEARLAFRGATATLEPDGARVLVADVGGGSTELAAGTPGGTVTWWASLPIGSGVLTDECLDADPPSAAGLAAARALAREALAAAGCPSAWRALAVGGSATSLRRLCGPVLSVPAIEAALELVCAGPAAERARALDLHVERLRLLPAGLVLLAEVARAAACPLEMASGGLREGVVLDLLARAG
jgi:exopolyphosphatase/guanosine-5'-triphosphate,3'-diphosphate pyrophosphatase